MTHSKSKRRFMAYTSKRMRRCPLYSLVLSCRFSCLVTLDSMWPKPRSPLSPAGNQTAPFSDSLPLLHNPGAPLFSRTPPPSAYASALQGRGGASSRASLNRHRLSGVAAPPKRRRTAVAVPVPSAASRSGPRRPGVDRRSRRYRLLRRFRGSTNDRRKPASSPGTTSRPRR